MENNDCYIGLELGTSSIRLAAGFVLNEQVYILTVLEEPCSGIENGLIVEQEEVIKGIKRCVVILS